MPTESHAEYRRRAEECVRLAKLANNSEVRASLLYLATRWVDFAADATSVPSDDHEAKAAGQVVPAAS
jgi:hypothetical protein